jgi:hypothetical protein
VTAGQLTAPVLTDEQRAVLAQAMGDALTYRHPPSRSGCADCTAHPGGERCETHEHDVALMGAYIALTRELAIEVSL